MERSVVSFAGEATRLLYSTRQFVKELGVILIRWEVKAVKAEREDQKACKQTLNSPRIVHYYLYKCTN